MSVPLAYWSAGSRDAPVLVLGASLGASHEMWAPQMAALARDFRVVAFDHRGHGASPAPPGPYSLAELGQDVLDLMDGLGVARFGYAGLSLGGMVGMWLGAHATQRVDRLAVLCSAPRMDPSGWYDRAAAVRAHGPGSVAAAVVERWFTPEFAAAHPELVGGYRGMFAGADPEGYAGCCEAIAGMNLLPVLADVRAATLVVAGERDPSTPPAQAEAIARAIPGARLEVAPDVAHLANVAAPELVTRLLAEHFSVEG